MEIIVEELGIPKKYLRTTDKEDRFIACVHRSWLKCLVKHSKLEEFSEKCNKKDVWSANEESTPFWEHIVVRVFKKWDVKVLPLPRIRKLECSNSPLFLVQLLQYISQVNHKNLVKNAQKKYSNDDKINKDKPVTLINYNEALKDSILRIYGCPIVNVCDTNLNTEISADFEVHQNILPAICCIETLNSIFLLQHPYLDYTLNDCVNFSPAILEKCYAKPLFIVYQLLQAFRTLHDRSLTIGDISLNDIYLTENLWIYIMPDITSNLHVQNIESEKENQHDCSKNGHRLDNQLKCDYCGVSTYDRVQVKNENLEKLCQLWMSGNISNFTYITSLNNLSGRKIGDPNCHHVFPWVTDFASRCGKNWRDLKRSKYRLNKGDRQLDLTYEGSQTQISHHVSDVLSAITYFVYTARRTPKSVLCKNVRTIWVPAEYPSSIQRMQEWTPDECIPEFFTDPSIFRSIHDDLDDLEVPPWCSGPEDFIERNRSALESQHVSERLHHWIDLTFGFKLSGNAAIKAKNVCLHLADEHTNLTKSGIVQLFSHPHPSRYSAMQIFPSIPNRAGFQKASRQRNRDRSHSFGVETSRTEDEETPEDLTTTANTRSSLGFTRFLSQSRTSLHEEMDFKSSRSPSRSASVGPKSSSFTSHVSSRSKHQPVISKSDTIKLPKELKPELAIDLLEKRHLFFSKTFHSQHSKSIIFPQEDEESTKLSNQLTVQNSFTNFIFSEPFELNNSKISFDRNNTLSLSRNAFYPYVKQRTPVIKSDCFIFCDYSGLISKCRIRELQVLGCLIVEIFFVRKLQAFSINKTNMKFYERLKACVTILRSCSSEFPPCIKYIATLLLQPETMDFSKFSYPVITEFGLPTPSAHLLLEPSLHVNIPFSKHFPSLYRLLSILKDFDNISNEINILYHFDCDGFSCSEFENLETTKILFVQNIAECKVKTCAKLSDTIFEEINTTTDVAIVDIMLPHMKELLEDPPTSVLTAWYLFDPFSRIMGPQKTSKTLLESVLKLYENEPTECTIPYHGRIAKLYHHSFLLRLMVRLGLKCFLENFIAPIVEAVGGYRDFEKVDFILHSHHEKVSKKTSHLKTMDTEQGESSPSDDSSFSSGGKANISPKRIQVPKEPEIFDFEEEKSNEKQLQSLIEHLELNVSSDLPFNHSTAEEALDAALAENIDHLRNLEELKINISEDYDEKLLMSPITLLPTSQHYEFNNISCEIGNRKSENGSLYDKKSTDTEDNIVDNLDETDTKHAPSSSKNNAKNKLETRISDMSADSLIWLSHRLGPVLTARYLSRNLLKMLTLCYVGKDNLVPILHDPDFHNDIVSITSSHVVGDRNAVKVLECLVHIAGLYGEQFILFQYIPHISELIALFKRKVSLNLEGGLISCLALLKHVIPYLSDSTLMDQLQDNILRNVIHPAVRLLGSTKYNFPSGYIARSALANKYVDTMYVLSIRIGSDMTRSHLAVPALQRFFLIFDKLNKNESITYREDQKNSPHEGSNDSNVVELNKDGPTREWNVNTAQPIPITHVRLKDSESIDSLSPPNSSQPDGAREDNSVNTAFQQLQSVFTPQLAHTAYMPFLKHLGASSLEISLNNHEHIKDLCKEYTNAIKVTSPKEIPLPDLNRPSTMVHSGSIGSNVAVIGNRIEVQSETDDAYNSDLLNLVSNKIENNNRHLRGNWFAYWGHEIGRSDKDIMFNFKQIKLQTFNGHSHSVKCLYVLDNENSFMSGSRDKTVKLWSLRSQGDGSSVSNCQWTYTAHKKSVLSITFIESMRLVASCDSVIHIWDPFMGVNVGVLESPKYAPVNTLKTMPAPSCLVYAATTDGTLKIIDTRLCSYIYELKVSVSPPGLIRCLAISPSGMWVAAGQSSGNIAVLDSRTGLIISSWRAHENEVLQLVAVDNNTLISSSLDQTISVWSVSDGKFKFHMRGSTEPVHCLNVYNTELISGSTANRIGVHTSIDADASFSSTKLRSDAFKGLLTSMALLPLNRLLLLGADTGNINLLC